MDDGRRLEQERSVLLAWGEVIRRYRYWKGLSRRELAQRAGLSPVFLGEIERGEKDPSSHSLCLVAAALRVELAELYLRVASRLGTGEEFPAENEQTSLPLRLGESGSEHLEGVPKARDETAYELYSIVRGLPADQQVSLLVLARSIARDRSPENKDKGAPNAPKGKA